MKYVKDFAEFKIYEMTDEEFNPIWEPLVVKMFDETSLVYDWRDLLQDHEKQKLKALRERTKERATVNLVAHLNGELVGWSKGVQETHEQFFVMNSAVFEAFRRKGVYTELIRTINEKAMELGFQRIHSTHMISNNAVIIAKLKQGFRITGFECSDYMGMLVHLTYFSNPKRNEILDFRAGWVKPTDEIRKLFRL